MSYKQITNTTLGSDSCSTSGSTTNSVLLHDDLYKSNDVVIDEAVRRRPQRRSSTRRNLPTPPGCPVQHKPTPILPNEQWTKMEDDKSYLDTYIAEVEKELAEKKEWYRTH
uniref:Cytochrome b-c1 complex subunit 7 n=1 Tax=Ixodes ricinus TaxID=34613 RepID=A0A0K8RJI0_IXORI